MKNKPQGYLGQVIKRKAAKLTHTSYTMTVEYREKLIKEIEDNTLLPDAILNYDDESIYLSFIKLGMNDCEWLTQLCRNHGALFIFCKSPNTIKIEIFKPIAIEAERYEEQQ